jgi:serine protease Do
VSHGVVVEQASGAAAHAGIMAGDIILGVNGVAVTSVDDLKKMVDPQTGHIALLIQRGTDKIFVPVTLG